MVQINRSLTSMPQRSDMNRWCIPIENCDYMPIISDKIKITFLCNEIGCI